MSSDDDCYNSPYREHYDDDDYPHGDDDDYPHGDDDDYLLGYSDHGHSDNSDNLDYEDDDHDDYEEHESPGATAHPKSTYAPEISAAAIKKIIQEAMVKENVRDGEIPFESEFIGPQNRYQSHRYFESKSFAWFSCPNKHRRWPSAHTWCFIDLKKQVICYRDEQKCNGCESKANPEFTEESIERMATYVVKRYLIRIGRRQPEKHSGKDDTEETRNGPHDEQRCGKCARLGRSCWK